MYIAQRFALNDRSILADILYRFFTLSVTAEGYKKPLRVQRYNKKMIYANFGGWKVKENEKGNENCRKYATEMKNAPPDLHMEGRKNDMQP